MAEVFTPLPPPEPIDCVDPTPTSLPPSDKWRDDYFGKRPPPQPGAANIGQNGIDGIWWPNGQALQYIGRQLLFDGREVDAGSGFELVVPDNELWRINWLSVDWITNTGSGTRFFLLNAYDFLGSGFGYYVLGKATPGDNDGGTVTWLPGVQSVAPVTQQIQEPMPRPLFLYANWHMQIQINNGGADFLNSLRGDIERWLIVGAPDNVGAGGGPIFSGPGPGGSGGGGGFFDLSGP